MVQEELCDEVVGGCGVHLCVVCDKVVLIRGKSCLYYLEAVGVVSDSCSGDKGCSMVLQAVREVVW